MSQKNYTYEKKEIECGSCMMACYTVYLKKIIKIFLNTYTEKNVNNRGFRSEKKNIC